MGPARRDRGDRRTVGAAVPWVGVVVRRVQSVDHHAVGDGTGAQRGVQEVDAGVDDGDGLSLACDAGGVERVGTHQRDPLGGVREPQLGLLDPDYLGHARGRPRGRGDSGRRPTPAAGGSGAVPRGRWGDPLGQKRQYAALHLGHGVEALLRLREASGCQRDEGLGPGGEVEHGAEALPARRPQGSRAGESFARSSAVGAAGRATGTSSRASPSAAAASPRRPNPRRT